MTAGNPNHPASPLKGWDGYHPLGEPSEVGMVHLPSVTEIDGMVRDGKAEPSRSEKVLPSRTDRTGWLESVPDLGWLIDVRGASVADAAVMYASHGWAVFPLLGKLPAIPKDEGGRGLHDATADVEMVRAWWQRWPSANIGWAIPSGLWVWDEDPRHAGDFARHMAELAHTRLPMTLRQVTGGGGEHWIWRSPVGVSVRQGSGFIDGCDTRTAGKGYIAVAPSVHPDTRRTYDWRAIVKPVEAPTWLIELVRAPDAKPTALYVPPAKVDASHLTRRHRYARAALSGLAVEVAGAAEGSRNDTLNRAWWRILQFRDVVPESEARAELTHAARAAGLDEREIAKVLR